jgi:ubiquinone/menaquinone biosynthesis C-methylase UbiE
MENFVFDKNYNKYWKNRVETSIDGTKVADNNIVGGLIVNLNIKNADKVLDLGCGYGRLFSLLNTYTSKVYGIDIDPSMVNDATTFDYYSLHTATAEDTKFPDNYFDKVVVFGVFDVVEQECSLVELNRILKVGGQCLITGKNINYCEDDEKALVAEKNARQKNFPNHFTDVKKLLENMDDFGFSCDKLTVFKRRGDFGDNKKIEIGDIELKPDVAFYEYCIILRKEQMVLKQPDINFASRISKNLVNATSPHNSYEI